MHLQVFFNPIVMLVPDYSCCWFYGFMIVYVCSTWCCGVARDLKQEMMRLVLKLLTAEALLVC